MGKPKKSSRLKRSEQISPGIRDPPSPNVTQSTAPLADPSVSQPSVPAVVQNHTPSIADQISGVADAVDPVNVNADLNGLSNYISQCLASIKHGGEKPDRPGSKFAIDLKELMSGVAETGKALCPDAKTIAQKFLQGMGGLHMLATGFLLVGNIMERYETISSNKEECVRLLERMNSLIQYVNKLRERHGLKEAMEDTIKKAIELIIEVFRTCCTQIDRPKRKSFFSTTVDTKELQGFRTRLTDLHWEIQLEMGVSIHELLRRPLVRPQPSEEFIRENGVQIEKVTELLKWKSKERAVAVILYGLGGTGKTALADAVYSSMYRGKMLQYMNHEEVLECKYSFVRLFDNTKDPDISKLQAQVLEDLGSPRMARRYEDALKEIESILEKEVVFIYIDNVLFPDEVEGCLDAIERLLPRTTKKVKKLRLLITTRDKGAAAKACNNLRIKTELYPIETLEDAKAMQLVKEELNDGEEDRVNEQLNGRHEKLDSNQINQIVQICGGIPQLLIKVAQHIGYSQNREEASQNREEAQERYQEVISETENNWNGHEGWAIARYAFAHDHLEKHLQDPFFDICLYFQGWHWEELSDIVGKYELKMLENRALVTKDVNRITKDVNRITAKVHNVILAIGIHNKGRRFKFTSASEFRRVLNPPTDVDLCDIKGIWSNDNIGAFDIPARKLDFMCGSLRVLALGNSTKVMGRCNQTFEELFFFSGGISHLPVALGQMPSNLISNLRLLRLRDPQQVHSLPESNGQCNLFDSINLSSTDLKELPDRVCNLNLSGCVKLVQLCADFKELSLLRVLSLKDCRMLKNLPENFHHLSSLTEITMDNCRRLENLPDRFGEVRSLRKLSLLGCVSLKKLPDSFRQLEYLEVLNLTRCVNLVQLCADFKELSSLRVLSLKECQMLKNLPENFHRLPSLEHLCLSDCDKLEGKPMESIVKMKTLQIVDIQGSPLLDQAWQNIEEVCNQWSHKVVRTSGQGSSNEESVERNDGMQE